MFFRKTEFLLSSVDPKILAFSSHCSVKFQLMLDYLIPNFKLKYEDSENVKTDHVNVVISTCIK